MREWPVRGDVTACACNGGGNIAEACIRAHKGDEHGTMGFFLAGFVRDDAEKVLTRDALNNKVVGDLPQDVNKEGIDDSDENDEEWSGFADDKEEPSVSAKLITPKG